MNHYSLYVQCSFYLNFVINSKDKKRTSAIKGFGSMKDCNCLPPSLYEDDCLSHGFRKLIGYRKVWRFSNLRRERYSYRQDWL